MDDSVHAFCLYECKAVLQRVVLLRVSRIAFVPLSRSLAIFQKSANVCVYLTHSIAIKKVIHNGLNILSSRTPHVSSKSEYKFFPLLHLQ